MSSSSTSCQILLIDMLDYLNLLLFFHYIQRKRRLPLLLENCIIYFTFKNRMKNGETNDTIGKINDVLNGAHIDMDANVIIAQLLTDAN